MMTLGEHPRRVEHDIIHSAIPEKALCLGPFHGDTTLTDALRFVHA